MEILVYIDEDDKKYFKEKISDLYVAIEKNEVPVEDLPQLKITLQNNTSKFWDDMQQKYPYIRNKNVAINTLDGYIFSYTIAQDYYRFCHAR